MRGIVARTRRLLADKRGGSLIEFSLVTPVIAFGLLMMVDVGSSIGERMELDQILRAGAESVMSGGDDSEVLAVMSGAKQAGQNMSLSVNRYCACPDAQTTSVSCSAPCGSTPPNVYVDLSAADTYSGIFMPTKSLASGIRVQLR